MSTVTRARAFSDAGPILVPLARSLMNETLPMLIVLSLLALVLVHKVEHFASDVLSEGKLGLLQEVDSNVRIVVDGIRTTDDDLRRIAQHLHQLTDQPQIAPTPEARHDLQRLTRALNGLRGDVTRLLASHDRHSDEVVRRIASVVAEAYLAARNCRQWATHQRAYQHALSAHASALQFACHPVSP